MTRDDCFDLNARDIFFRPIRITTCEMRRIIVHPLLALFIILATAAFVAFDAGALQPHMAVWQAAFVWLVTISQQVLTYSALTMLWAWLQDRMGAPRIYLPAIGVVAFASTYLTTVLHVSLQSGRGLEEVIVISFLLIGLLSNLIFEALFFAFVLPILRADIAEDAPEMNRREITIAGERFHLDQVLTMRAQEHFVVVTTPEGDQKLRARLSDLVSQTLESDGTLAHRSHWISRHAIAGLLCENGSDVILTRSGKRLAVARPRKDHVRNWIAEHAPHVAENNKVDMREMKTQF